MDYKKISLGLLIVAVVLLVGLILTYLKMQSLSAVKIDKASQVNSASDLEAMSALDRDPEVLKQTLETKKGLVVDKYLASEIPMPQVTEAEMKLFYGMNKEQLQGIKFEEIKDKIEFELIQQKRREAYKRLVAKLT